MFQDVLQRVIDLPGLDEGYPVAVVGVDVGLVRACDGCRKHGRQSRHTQHGKGAFEPHVYFAHLFVMYIVERCIHLARWKVTAPNSSSDSFTRVGYQVTRV